MSDVVLQRELGKPRDASDITDLDSSGGQDREGPRDLNSLARRPATIPKQSSLPARWRWLADWFRGHVDGAAHTSSCLFTQVPAGPLRIACESTHSISCVTVRCCLACDCTLNREPSRWTLARMQSYQLTPSVAGWPQSPETSPLFSKRSVHTMHD